MWCLVPQFVLLITEYTRLSTVGTAALPGAKHPSRNQKKSLPLTPSFQVPRECTTEAPAADLMFGAVVQGPEQRKGSSWDQRSIWVPHSSP